MKNTDKPVPLPRYDRDRWLEKALFELAREGGARLRVEALAKSLGVTKGSFYHHFRNREDFVLALIEYWSKGFTDSVISIVGTRDDSPSGRLLALTRYIETEELDRFDIAFRSWAAQDPIVAEALKEVDIKRYEFVCGLFEGIGFTGAELNMRVKVWLVFASARRSVYTPARPDDAEDEVQIRHEFFSR